MTIVDHFDPSNVRHIQAWKRLGEVMHDTPEGLTQQECEHIFATALRVVTIAYDWPEDWAFLISAKMADAWIEFVEGRFLSGGSVKEHGNG